MALKEEKKINRIESKREKRFNKYERTFSAHKYNGHGKEFMKEISGTSDVLVVSPFSVNCNEPELIKVNRFSGALARLLAYETGCRGIFASKTFKTEERDTVRSKYTDIISNSHTKVIIELRTNSVSEPMLRVSEGGYIPENKGSFFNRLAIYIAEYECRDSVNKAIAEVNNNYANSMICDIAKNLEIPVLILDFKECDLQPSNTKGFKKIYVILKRILILLTSLDFEADNYDVYRVWQASAKSQIPQDKVEFINIKDTPFEKNAFLHMCSFEGIHETARVNTISENTLLELDAFLELHPVGKRDDYVVLTNRLIETLFGREWFEGHEKLPGLRGIPIILYENKRERYEIGIPKANQVNNIALSSALYKEKWELSNQYDYLVFNRYSDSKIYIEVEKPECNYNDNGRVKSQDGIPNAKKVMLPRYYRLMMGYLEKPLKTIRAEEYWKIVLDIPEKNKKDKKNESGLKYEITKEDFKRCYQEISGQAYFQFVEEKDVKSKDEKKLYKESKQRIVKYFEKIGIYSHVDLIRVPKKAKPRKKLKRTIHELIEKIHIKILKITIGKAEYILKTRWVGDTDDKNSVARLNNNMMSLIGVSENDKILIRFGDNITTLRVLPKNELSDYEIGIPASGRKTLKMNSMNDIVIVHRDMSHIFKRHSQEQTIAILGTVLAVAQVLTAFEIFTKSWLGIVVAVVVCILAIIFMLYFALGEERVKVK